MSDEQLRKALELQACRVQAGRSLPLSALLAEMGTLGQDELDAALERQARERIRLYGKQSRGG